MPELVVPDKLIWDVPALKVKPVIRVVNQTETPEPLNVTVLLPRLIVRVLLLLDDRDMAVTLLLLVVKVPCVTVTDELDVRASPRVSVIPDPDTSIPQRVCPALVRVPVPLNIKFAVEGRLVVMPATKVALPEIVKLLTPPIERVPVKPVQLSDLATRLPLIVQVTAPDAASKNTSSAAVGTA